MPEGLLFGLWDTSTLWSGVFRWFEQISRDAPQISSLEWGLVALYLAVMVVLSAYGLHRYQLIYLYYRHRNRAAPEPNQRFTELPSVTVQLPLYNEQFVVEQLLAAVCRLDYPKDRLQIQVLDDSNDETSEIAGKAVARWAAEGYPVEYVHRRHRHGFKAGALQAGLDTARGELIAVFDADFQPLSDFLQRTVHHFTNPNVGVKPAGHSATGITPSSRGFKPCCSTGISSSSMAAAHAQGGSSTSTEQRAYCGAR